MTTNKDKSKPQKARGLKEKQEAQKDGVLKMSAGSFVVVNGYMVSSNFYNTSAGRRIMNSSRSSGRKRKSFKEGDKKE